MADCYRERLNSLKDRLKRIDAAMTIALEAGVAEFSLDTGQSNQRVKNYTLADLESLEASTLKRIAFYESKLKGNIVYLRRL